MRVHRFLPAFVARRIVKAAALVHVYALESARACSKLTWACLVHPKIVEEASLYKT
jgi:hypothetical protein